MRRLTLTVLLLICACAATSPHPLAIPHSDPTPAPLDVEQGLPVVTLALERRDGALRPTPLVLDLGANIPISLTADIWEDAAFTPGNPEGTRRLSNLRGELLLARTQTLKRLELAGLRADNVPLTEAVWHPDYAPPLRLGVVGWPLLVGHRVRLDLHAQTLALLPPSTDPAACPHPILLRDDGLYVQITLDGRPTEALLDTAATHTFVATSEALTAPILLNTLPVEVGPRHLLPPLEGWARWFVDRPEVILGLPFFQAYTVTLDLRALCLSVTPHPPASPNAAGVTLPTPSK